MHSVNGKQKIKTVYKRLFFNKWLDNKDEVMHRYAVMKRLVYGDDKISIRFYLTS